MLKYCFFDQHIIIWVEVFVILMVQDSIGDVVEASKAACLPEQGETSDSTLDTDSSNILMGNRESFPTLVLDLKKNICLFWLSDFKN